jgi:hypothetical protein
VTTTPVKPIETEYRGYRFRSRLEARWAVAFDAMGINWLYEPEGYMVNDRPYLPDFWLPDLGVWVEVKGTLSRGDLGRLVDAAGPDGLPLELGCGHRPRLEDPRTWGARILILGPIPDPKTASLHSMVWYFAGEVVTYWVNLRHRPDGRWQFLVIDAPRHTGDHWETMLGHSSPKAIRSTSLNRTGQSRRPIALDDRPGSNMASRVPQSRRV